MSGKDNFLGGDNDHRGWHGVTDPSYSLYAVSYEPVEGTLACRFRTGIYLFLEVPERQYKILLHSPFAGAYFRKQIKSKYASIDPHGIPLPAKLDDSAVKNKLKILAKKRFAAVPRVEMTLFGPANPGIQAKQKQKHSIGG